VTEGGGCTFGPRGSTVETVLTVPSGRWHSLLVFCSLLMKENAASGGQSGIFSFTCQAAVTKFARPKLVRKFSNRLKSTRSLQGGRVITFQLLLEKRLTSATGGGVESAVMTLTECLAALS
jgi:hypothetical protein